MWFLLAACRTEDDPAPAEVPDQAELARVELPLEDPSRPTPEVGDAPGAPTRALPTWVWVGAAAGEDAGRRPLLVMAHGVDGHPTKFEAFATALADAGVVVAAPAFPVSNGEVGVGLLSAADLPEQPADVAFVLEALLDAVADRASPLFGRFDPDRIAIFGHSMGGATVLGLCRHGAAEHPAFEAELYLSPATLATGVFPAPFEPAGPPTLLMHGLDDHVLPIVGSELLFEDLEGPRWFLGLAGADHSSPIESQDEVPERIAAQDAVLALLLDGPDALSQTMDRLGTEGNTTAP